MIGGGSCITVPHFRLEVGFAERNREFVGAPLRFGFVSHTILKNAKAGECDGILAGQTLVLNPHVFFLSHSGKSP